MNYSDNEDVKIYVPKIKNPTDINKEENEQQAFQDILDSITRSFIRNR